MARTCNDTGFVVRNNLREIRLSKNISQEELARKIWTSSVTISNIENDKYTPNGLMMFLLASELDVKIEELFYLAELSEPIGDFTHKRVKRK